MTMKLYEIPDEMRRIDAMIDEAGGELTPEVEATLNYVQSHLEEGVDWVSGLIREREARAAAYKAEADAMTARRKAEEAAAARYKHWLKAALEATGVDRVEGRLFKASLQKAGRPSIAWTLDVDDLPEEFRRVSVAPDLQAAQDAYDRGLLPDGFVATFSTSLRIR